MGSMYSMNRIGETGEPCGRPAGTAKVGSGAHPVVQLLFGLG